MTNKNNINNNNIIVVVKTLLHILNSGLINIKKIILLKRLHCKDKCRHSSGQT